jgi:hypothetical protein
MLKMRTSPRKICSSNLIKETKAFIKVISSINLQRCVECPIHMLNPFISINNSLKSLLLITQLKLYLMSLVSFKKKSSLKSTKNSYSLIFMVIQMVTCPWLSSIKKIIWKNGGWSLSSTKSHFLKRKFSLRSRLWILKLKVPASSQI